MPDRAVSAQLQQRISKDWMPGMVPTPNTISPRSEKLATAGGFAAIVLWSTAVAFARSLSEQLGAVTALAAVYVVSGTIAFGCDILWRRQWHQIWQLSRMYLFGCGGLFISYMLLLFMAVGAATDRQQALEVGLLNYLWPTLTLVFSLFVLNKRAGRSFIPGTLIALAGVCLVLTHQGQVSWASFFGNLAGNPAAYGMGFSAAIVWALYSVLTSRWAGGASGGAIALFMPVTAIAMLFLSFWVEEPRAWSGRVIVEVGFLGVATYLGYALWDAAMRRGNVVLVAAASYLTPLLSTVVVCLYLSVIPGFKLWIGCALLITGALLSWHSVSEGDT